MESVCKLDNWRVSKFPIEKNNYDRLQRTTHSLIVVSSHTEQVHLMQVQDTKNDATCHSKELLKIGTKDKGLDHLYIIIIFLDKCVIFKN